MRIRYQVGVLIFTSFVAVCQGQRIRNKNDLHLHSHQSKSRPSTRKGFFIRVGRGKEIGMTIKEGSRYGRRHRHNFRGRRHPSEEDTAVTEDGKEIMKPSSRRLVGSKSAVGYGLIFALNSGYVNGICLSGLLSLTGTKQASAAVTGAWTNSALGIACGNFEQFYFNSSCILSFMVGSFITGYLNPFPKPYVISVPKVQVLLLIGSALLYSASVLCRETEAGKSFIFLAAIANGIQNSLTSTTTGNLVRSSHFSGISSDIGTFFGQFLRGNHENFFKLKVFSALASCFWIGGFGSYFMCQKFGSFALLVSSMLYLILALGLGFI